MLTIIIRNGLIFNNNNNNNNSDNATYVHIIAQPYSYSYLNTQNK